MLNWILDQAIALIALGIALWALWRTRLHPQPSRIIKKKPIPPKVSLPPIEKPPFVYFPVADQTHAIRNDKLVNRLAIHLRNEGPEVYYDNIEFSSVNKQVEVEILSEKELDFFNDSRDSQRVATGESLRITIEREIGASLDYDFKLFFLDKSDTLHCQHVKGKKGEVPTMKKF